MKKVIQEILAVQQGLNYLVPEKWWEQFYNINMLISDESKFLYPSLNLNNYVHSFILDFQHQIVQEIQRKSNSLCFKKVVLSAEPIDTIKWKPICPNLWKLISKKQKYQPVLTYLMDKSKGVDFCLQQVQIIFCSKQNSDLFVGFLPKNANLLGIIRQLGFQLGFIEMQNSKVTFPDRSIQKNYLFSQLSKYHIEDAPDTFLMVFNLQQAQEQFIQEQQIHSFMNVSNEAIVQDLQTTIEEVRERDNNDRTLSTGAQTPFSFFGSDGYDFDRQYRMNEVFRDKKPQQVHQMKINAKEAIYGQLIDVPFADIERMKEQLNKMGEEILQGLHIHKKKSKQKDINNQ